MEENEARDGSILTWGVAANVTRDGYVRQGGESKRPGAKHFVPGAKVWVLPIQWGDGGEHRYVVGVRRRTGGRELIRVVMRADRLVNFRLEAVRSPWIHKELARPLGEGIDRDGVRHLRTGLYDSREAASSDAYWQRELSTSYQHLLLETWVGMHNADQRCAFCDGAHARAGGTERAENPFEIDPGRVPGTVDWWTAPHGMWDAGWRSEDRLRIATEDDDLVIRLVTQRRRALHEEARMLQWGLVGRTVHEVETHRAGYPSSVVVRFVREPDEPRALDGVVHAWIDEDDVVVRTRSWEVVRE